MYQCGLYSFQVAGKKRGARKPQRRYEREQRTFYKQAIREKRDLVETLRKKNFDKLDQMERVDVINAKAAFVDAHTLLLSGSEGEREITGDKVFINTGSVPKLPDMAGMRDNSYVYTSKTLMEEEELPKRLAIVGGGFIGLEYASMYQSFGSEVTLLVSSDRLLADEDEDIAEAIAERLQEMGVKILLGARATEIREDVLVYSQAGEEKKLENTRVLFAIGRAPNTEGLVPEKASVELTEKGLVKTDEHLRTTADGIWAMGDVCSRLQFTYTSLDDFRIVKSDVLEDGSYRLSDRKNVPFTTFIDPPYASVGLNERKRKRKDIQSKCSPQKPPRFPRRSFYKSL